MKGELGGKIMTKFCWIKSKNLQLKSNLFKRPPL